MYSDRHRPPHIVPSRSLCLAIEVLDFVALKPYAWSHLQLQERSP